MSTSGLTWLRGGLTAIPGVRVGHQTDVAGATGVTAIVFDRPVHGGVDIRGGAAGTRQFSALDPLHVAGGIDAVIFAGGSAHGLEAGTGAMRWLEARGRGLPVVPGQFVPIVPTAILFDLGIGVRGVRPDAAMGEAACDAATAGPVREGSVGAGTGATVGKCLGVDRSMKGGVGSAAARLSTGARVGALVVVNAFGDVVEPGSRRPLAGVRAGPRSRRLLGSRKVLLERGGLRRYGDPPPDAPENTTLALVATDAALDQVALTQVARLAGQGMVRGIDPTMTQVDGDLVIAVATGERAPGVDDPTVLGLAAGEVVLRAIHRAVKAATSVAGVPGLGDAARRRRG